MNNPFDFFDKIYCINLPEHKNRKKDVSKEFEKVGILNRIKWISAPKPPKDFKIDLYRRNPAAEFGCSLSHITAIVDAISINAKNILIFEDDIVFVNDASNKLQLTLKELPDDWVGFYLGCTPVSATKFSNKLLKIKGWNTWGTYAYALNGKYLTEYFKHWTYYITHSVSSLYSPIDSILSEFVGNDLAGYACIPPIVKPKDGVISSIDNLKYNPYGYNKHWKPFNA